jgi:release factor glutamine methyltransferase
MAANAGQARPVNLVNPEAQGRDPGDWSFFADQSSAGVQATLTAFAGALADVGFVDYCAAFNPLFPRPHAWAVKRPAGLPRKLAALVRLFLEGAAVARRDLSWDARIEAGVELLAAAGIIEERHGEVLSQAKLISVLGMWHFSTEGQPERVVYVGDESMALLSHSFPSEGSQCGLDLCAGGGIQGLWMSRFMRSVTLVEIDPGVCAYAELNALINGGSGRIATVCGDLYAPVAGRRFDHITANPPLVPVPPGIGYPAVGHGGPDGLELFWRILDGMGDALSETGSGLVIGACLCGPGKPPLAGALAEWARVRCASTRMTVMARQHLAPGQPFFDALTHVCAAFSGAAPDEVERDVLAHTTASGGWLANFVVHIRHGSSTFDYVDVGQEVGANTWFALPGDVRLAHSAATGWNDR